LTSLLVDSDRDLFVPTQSTPKFSLIKEAENPSRFVGLGGNRLLLIKTLAGFDLKKVKSYSRPLAKVNDAIKMR